MARLTFEGTLSELIDSYTDVEIQRQSKTCQDTQRQAKTGQGTQSTPKDILSFSCEGDRGCGYTNAVYFSYEFDAITDVLDDLAAELDYDELSEDVIEEAIDEHFHNWDSDSTDEDVIFIDDDKHISYELSEAEFQQSMFDACPPDGFVCVETQYYRGWCFSAEIPLPNDRKRGQIHTIDCEVDFTDWGDASPAGCGLDWHNYLSEDFIKKCLRYIAVAKLNQTITNLEDLDLDIQQID